MTYPSPIADTITIYSKSGCVNCKKAKIYLETKNEKYVFIDCDEYLIEDKEDFLLFISNKALTEVRQFPMIFLGSRFLGGYTELLKTYELDFEQDF